MKQCTMVVVVAVVLLPLLCGDGGRATSIVVTQFKGGSNLAAAKQRWNALPYSTFDDDHARHAMS